MTFNHILMRSCSPGLFIECLWSTWCYLKYLDTKLNKTQSVFLFSLKQKYFNRSFLYNIEHEESLKAPLDSSFPLSSCSLHVEHQCLLPACVSPSHVSHWQKEGFPQAHISMLARRALHSWKSESSQTVTHMTEHELYLLFVYLYPLSEWRERKGRYSSIPWTVSLESNFNRFQLLILFSFSAQHYRQSLLMGQSP